MNIKCKIKMNYNDSESAKIIYDSLEVDNKGFVDSELKKSQITYTIESETLGSFLTTADDLIASEILSERIIDSTNNDN